MPKIGVRAARSKSNCSWSSLQLFFKELVGLTTDFQLQMPMLKNIRDFQAFLKSSIKVLRNVRALHPSWMNKRKLTVFYTPHGKVTKHWLCKVILQNIILVKSSFFAYLPKILSRIKENLSKVQKHFTFKAILIYSKPAMTCFKYQEYLYG